MLTACSSNRNQPKTLIRPSDITEGKQEKNIVDDMEQLSEYVRNARKDYSSQWCQMCFILTSTSAI